MTVSNVPLWRGRPGWYEDYYVKANVPDQRASVWFRYTLVAPADGPNRAHTWAIVEQDGSYAAARNGVPLADATLGAEPFAFDTVHGRLTDSGCRGAVDGVDWDISWSPSPYAFEHLPGWTDRLPLPRSGVCTPNPDLAISGVVKGDGWTLDLDGAPGAQGHVWGSQRAAAWGWSHCSAHHDVTWEALTARTAVAGGVHSTATVVLVRYGGRTIAFRVPWRTEGAFDLDAHTFRAHAGRFRVEGRVEPKHLACVTYPNPDGSETYCHNTKRASSTITLSRRRRGRWERVGTWRDEGTTAYEVGRGRREPSVPLVV